MGRYQFWRYARIFSRFENFNAEGGTDVPPVVRPPAELVAVPQELVPIAQSIVWSADILVLRRCCTISQLNPRLFY
jgi:hypothetical protein